MSEDRRKNLRTQGKYSDGKVQKSRDKKQRSSLESKDSPEMRLPKRNSDGNKSVSSLADESASSLKYEEKSDYSFHQLDEVLKPTEIKGKGEFILSTTDKGQSRILYEPRFLYEDEANDYFNHLYETINFDSRNIVIRGVEYPQPRLVAWFGPFPYSYSGVTLEAAEMPDAVLKIKGKVESYLKSKNITETFNSVLINLYRDGKDSVAWHSDDELMLGVCPTIASVSLGEIRKFEIRPKAEMKDHEDRSPSNSAQQFVIHLTHGSLVVMTGCMQEDWQHRVPKEYHDKNPRINLTFRTVYPLEQVRHLVRKRRLSQRKSWQNTPRKKIRFDDFASPSSVNNSYSRDANESYDEARGSNYNLSIDSENISSGEKQDVHNLYVTGRKTSTERHRKRYKLQMDDTDLVHETESSYFPKTNIACKSHKKSRSTDLHSAITNENESYISSDNESYKSDRKTSTKRYRKSKKNSDDTDMVHKTDSSDFQESPIAYKASKKSRSTDVHSALTNENESYLSTDNKGNNSGWKTSEKRRRKSYEIKLLDDTDLIHETESSYFPKSSIACKSHKKSRSIDLHSAITNENESYISTDNEIYKSDRKTSTKRHRKSKKDIDMVHKTDSSDFQESPIAYKASKKSRSTSVHSALTNENESYLSTDNSVRKTSEKRHRKSYEIKLSDDSDLIHETGSSNSQESPIKCKGHRKSRSTNVHSAVTNYKSYITDNKRNNDKNVHKKIDNVPYTDVKDLHTDNEDISD